MDRYAMLTAFGQDRPGIVAAVAEGLYRLHCNIEDTCMTRLRGEFSMMVLVRLPAELSPDLLAEQMVPYTEPLRLSVLCREVPAQTMASESSSDAPAYMLSVYGADRPGIVAKVARVLMDHEANITDMNTRVIGTAERPIYVMLLEVQLRPDQGSQALESALEALKPALSVDLTFRAIESLRL
jgi:glycine cleavage system transcriptional repressor